MESCSCVTRTCCSSCPRTTRATRAIACLVEWMTPTTVAAGYGLTFCECVRTVCAARTSGQSRPRLLASYVSRARLIAVTVSQLAPQETASEGSSEWEGPAAVAAAAAGSPQAAAAAVAAVGGSQVDSVMAQFEQQEAAANAVPVAGSLDALLTAVQAAEADAPAPAPLLAVPVIGAVAVTTGRHIKRQTATVKAIQVQDAIEIPAFDVIEHAWTGAKLEGADSVLGAAESG